MNHRGLFLTYCCDYNFIGEVKMKKLRAALLGLFLIPEVCNMAQAADPVVEDMHQSLGPTGHPDAHPTFLEQIRDTFESYKHSCDASIESIKRSIAHVSGHAYTSLSVTEKQDYLSEKVKLGVVFDETHTLEDSVWWLKEGLKSPDGIRYALAKWENLFVERMSLNSSRRGHKILCAMLKDEEDLNEYDISLLANPTDALKELWREIARIKGDVVDRICDRLNQAMQMLPADQQ